MDLLYVIVCVCGVLLVASSVLGIYKTVHTRVVASRAGIVKVCVIRSTLIVHLVVCALFTFFGINRMNEAQKYLSMADKAERVIDRLDGIIGDAFQQVSAKASSESVSESSEDIRERIAKYREAGKTYKNYAAFLFIVAVSDLVSATSAFWYITEEGIMLQAFKTPEPFYATLNGNKIELNYKAQFKNANKVTAFRATPENLAVFGRFMVWEQEQNPQSPQNVLYPQSPQYQIAQNPNDKEQL